MTNLVVRSKMFKLASDTRAQSKQDKAIESDLPKVLYTRAGHYLKYSDPFNDVNQSNRIDFPLNIDTEFVTHPKHWSEPFEYREGQWVERLTRQTTRLHITTQMRGIHQDQGVIMTARECKDIVTRHKVLTTGFDPVDYLNHLGYSAEITRVDTSKFDRNLKKQFDRLPEFKFVLFAHFALAELMLITRDRYWDDFEALAGELDPKNPPGNPRFTQKRHLRAVTETIDQKTGFLRIEPSVKLPWVLWLNGRQFRVSVEWVDSCALHGSQASYKSLCESARVPLLYKDNFTGEEKGRMLDMAVDRPEDFDSYALGDLYVFDALMGNAENFKKVYESLGISHEYKEPALTIGSTVKNLFEARLANTLGIFVDTPEFKDLRSKFLSPVSAKELKQNAAMTRCLAAKVEGGRCRNNRPTDTLIDSPLCDIDLAGCYAEGLRYQPYPIGNPEILDFEASNRSAYWTLAQFRKTYGFELVRGLWVARVWTKEPLEYAQDFLASWFIPSVGDDLLAMARYIQQMSNDTEQSAYEVEFELDDGQLKIFTHEIINGVITHDFLDWLDYVATPRQRKELEAKLLIKVAIVYPKSWEIKGKSLEDCYKKLLAESEKHQDKDKIERVSAKGRKKLRREDGQYHGWFSVNIGELIIDDLLAWRKYYQKTEGKKKPMDLVFKLCCNTLYGDMTSKYFDCANTVVGNNVTARARSMVWYAEKGLHALQSITDGGCFELNRVVYPNTATRRVSGENVVNLYTLSDRESRIERGLKFGALGGYDKIDLTWNDGKPSLILIKDDESQTLSGKDATDWINQTALEHLQTLFPKVNVLHSVSKGLDAEQGDDGKPEKIYTDRVGLFSFEMKSFYDSGCFHGTANYVLKSPVEDNLKMRSYETKKPHESVSGAMGIDLDTKGVSTHPYVTDRYGLKNNPAQDFMTALSSGDPVARQVTFVKEGILKLSDFKDRRKKYRGLDLVPGDGYFKSGLLKEFSLSQFTFLTMKQFVEWEKRITRLKDKFGQSVERYFITTDKDGNQKLDFGSMVKTIDRLVREGVENPIETLDKHYNRSRDDVAKHPAYEVNVRLKELLGLSPED